MKRRGLSFLLALSMALTVTACSSQGGKSGGSSTADPITGGVGASQLDQKWYDDDGKIHVYASCTQTITSLDWMDCNNGNAFQCIFHMIGTPLIGTDHAGNYGPEYGEGITEAYEVNDDATEWTFHIRQGVTFNNGEACDADDVVCTLNRILEYKGQKENLGGVWMYLDKVEKVDQSTVKAYFTETYGTPLTQFGEMFIISDTDYAKLGEDYFYGGHLYGTGAWEFEDYMDGQFISLSRRDNYWGENDSNVDRFTLYFITEENAIINGLTSGTIDFTPRLSGDLTSLVDADPDLHQESANTYGSYALVGLQCGGQSPFHDSNLRKAFAYCIDRQMIADTIMGGGAALQQWIPEGSRGHIYNDCEPIYDPELAKQLVEQSDYNGEEIVLFANSPVNNAENIAVALCDYAKAVGINMSVQITEQAYTTEVRKTGKYDAYLVTNTSYGDEGSYTYSRLVHPGGANHNFNDPHLQELLERIPSTFQIEEREKLMAEINQIVYDNCVLVSLFTMDYHYGCRNGLTGWEIPFTGYFYCDQIRVS